MTFIKFDKVKVDILKEAYQGLYPTKELNHDLILRYSGRFSDYNAHVVLSSKKLEFKLSKKWQLVDAVITMGLIQTLMNKIFKTKKTTLNIELYNDFLKNIHLSVPKTKSHPILKVSFDRVNEKYFLHSIELPNLEWGSASKRKLGSYDFHTDTISISTIFQDADIELLDYVMYHEMLHKKFKFKSSSSRTLYHSKTFKQAEARFENVKEVESRINRLRWKKKPLLKKIFGF